MATKNGRTWEGQKKKNHPPALVDAELEGIQGGSELYITPVKFMPF